jgi:putative Mg2+ transporter-C (MgtC) family protein
MVLSPERVLRAASEVLAGGLIGVEREFRDKAAGFRTLIFICVGVVLFTISSARLVRSTHPRALARTSSLASDSWARG